MHYTHGTTYNICMLFPMLRNGQELQDGKYCMVCRLCMEYIFHYIVTAGGELLTTPFPCCILPNFIQDNDGFLDSLKDEILRLKYYEKDNDLYQFHQARVCVCVGGSMCVVHVCYIFIVFNVIV